MKVLEVREGDYRRKRLDVCKAQQTGEANGTTTSDCGFGERWFLDNGGGRLKSGGRAQSKIEDGVMLWFVVVRKYLLFADCRGRPFLRTEQTLGEHPEMATKIG